MLDLLRLFLESKFVGAGLYVGENAVIRIWLAEMYGVASCAKTFEAKEPEGSKGCKKLASPNGKNCHQDLL